MPQPL
jgi:hypothetical protein